MPQLFSTVSCSIEVYPFEGGFYSIQGGQIINLTTSKTLSGDTDGTFSITLAPGGPLGPEDPNTWSQIITPMSHIIIGMARGDDATIVLDGVVTEAGESQVWTTTDRGSIASRGQTIIGNDISYFFNSFNFWSLTFMGLVSGSGIEGQLGNLPAALTSLLSQGLVGGSNASNSSPVQIGRLWYEKVMAGPTGILNKTYVPYKGARISFTNLVAALWEYYPDIFIPYSDTFISMDTWFAKLKSIFSGPWYEFFITTAPQGLYRIPQGSNGLTDPGTLFTMDTMPSAVPAGPQLVARINPWPKFAPVAGSNPSGQVGIGPVDVSRWSTLPLFDLTELPYGFISSSVGFGADVANFYQLNPLSYSGLVGGNPTNNIPIPFTFIAAADQASISRYGFKPSIASTRWMFDPAGSAAQNQSLDIQKTILELTAAYISWLHPTPLMARANVTLPLAPNIRVGTKFRYPPFKDGEPWDFYVDAVKHDFTFGARAVTTVSLSRGLPAAIYADASQGGLLQAIMTGNASRLNGRYVLGLPPGSSSALEFVTTQDQAATLNQQLANTYVTPQPTTQPPPT